MSAKNITYPLLFDGGEEDVKVGYPYEKFPNKEELAKMTKDDKKRFKEDRVGFV